MFQATQTLYRYKLILNGYGGIGMMMMQQIFFRQGVFILFIKIGNLVFKTILHIRYFLLQSADFFKLQ